MATYRRLPSGLWQAQVFRRGIRRSETRPNKGAVQAWAAQVEAEIMAGVRGEVPNLTVAARLKRYGKEVSAGKKGERWENVRLKALQRDRLALVKLRHLDSPHVSDWQQRRLQAVSAASVRRERNLLNAAFEIARKEWRWLTKNPFIGVRRPKDSRPRSRIATPAEIAKLTAAASPALARVIAFALETGMRASEIAALRDVRGRVAYLADSKTGWAREVPLSAKALEIWEQGLGLTAGSISALFARLCEEKEV